MPRALVSEDDIRHLWDFFFDSQDSRIREAIGAVQIAILGTKRDILKHYNRPGTTTFFNILELLRSQGYLVGGLGDGFNEALDESFVDISFDTPDKNGIKVVPFSTQPDRISEVTVVAIFYGEKGDVAGGKLTLYFKLLASEGCDATFSRLHNAYPEAYIPECTPPSPPKPQRSK